MFEVAFVDLQPDRLQAKGTQLGSDYRLEHKLETGARFVSERLQLERRTVLLGVSRSRQRYILLLGGVVRFRSGGFTADVEFDANGFVVRCPGLAERVS